MICIGLPLQAAVKPSVQLNYFGLYDPDKQQFYSFRDLLACGKRATIRANITWKNCRKIRFIFTCGGSDGKAKKLIDVIINLPQLNGTGTIEVAGQNRRPFDTTQLLNACGYSCTAKQAHFCCDVVALG